MSPEGSHPWSVRRARALHLLGQAPHAEEILTFYAKLTEVQEAVAERVPVAKWLGLVRSGEGDFPSIRVEKLPLDELDSAGLLPERVYSQQELRDYLAHGRKKCRATLAGLTDAKAGQRCGFERLDMSVGALHLYNLRHVQHGAAQLNLILRQETDSAPGWVFRSAD